MPVFQWLPPQYNAVTGISTRNGSNIYRQKWDSPPGPQFSNQSQAAAISALLGGMVLSQGSDSGSPTSKPLPPSNLAAPVPIGAIVGGVLGGVVLIGVIPFSGWLYRWRRRQIMGSRNSSAPEVRISPFNLLVSVANQKSHEPDDLKWTQRPDDTCGTTNNNSENLVLPVPSISQPAEFTLEDLLLALDQQLQNEEMQSDRRWDPYEDPLQYLEIEGT
ncbi:hypothetical protein V5O48_015423 [Marasmius crinis-equi]|uniref:Uncharacterized protein n=1 Tax=Marasmius crinis-equi TaxID=585013 RepID=A0ABR3EUJ9_9AGAR